MAIYHLNTKVGSRAGGQSASAKADYIQREGRYACDPSEVEHAEPGRMPEWAKDDPQAYWEAADLHERANGRLFREIEFALPAEMDERQWRELAHEFAQSLIRAEQLPYTLAIHRGGGGVSPLPPGDFGAGQRQAVGAGRGSTPRRLGNGWRTPAKPGPTMRIAPRAGRKR